MSVRYNACGIATPRGVYWSSVVLGVLMLNAVILRTVYADQSLLLVVGELIWVIGVFVATVHLLKYIEESGRDAGADDPRLRRLFHAASLMMPWGALILLFAMRFGL